jgi:hypothetical protein
MMATIARTTSSFSCRCFGATPIATWPFDDDDYLFYFANNTTSRCGASIFFCGANEKRHAGAGGAPPPSEHLGLFRQEQKLFPPQKNPTGST